MQTQTAEQLAKISRDAQERLAEMAAVQRRKENGKKVGKTFKFRNSYSCPQQRSDFWYLYSKVVRMDDGGYLYTLDFQTDKYGHINIRFDNYAYHMQGHTQIPAAEFNRAWKSMRAKLDRAG